MSSSILALFNRNGCISDKKDSSSGYAFDGISNCEVEGITVRYHGDSINMRLEHEYKYKLKKIRKNNKYRDFCEEFPIEAAGKRVAKLQKAKDKRNQKVE
jgi:hypothetical protein